MDTITGKNLEVILANYAKEHNVDKESLIYYVLEENPGFLGFGASVTVELFSPQHIYDFVHNYLDSFFEGLGMETQIQLDVKGNNINVNLSAHNNAIIIGKNGSSLEGLNLVLRNAVNSKFKRRFYTFVDVNNYKKDRYDKLNAMAQRIAKTVQRTRVDVALDPMPNDERKTIHKILQNVPHVQTKSEGSGRNRHLKIIYVANKE